VKLLEVIVRPSGESLGDFMIIKLIGSIRRIYQTNEFVIKMMNRLNVKHNYCFLVINKIVDAFNHQKS